MNLKLKPCSGEELQKKYGLHDAHKALLPPGDRNARSVKAAGCRAWVLLPVGPRTVLPGMQINYQPFSRTLDELFEFAEKDVGWVCRCSC